MGERAQAVDIAARDGLEAIPHVLAGRCATAGYEKNDDAREVNCVSHGASPTQSRCQSVAAYFYEYSSFAGWSFGDPPRDRAAESRKSLAEADPLDTARTPHQQADDATGDVASPSPG